MTAIPMRKKQFPHKTTQLYKELEKHRPVLLSDVTKEKVSNIIAHFRRKGATVHSRKTDSMYLLWME